MKAWDTITATICRSAYILGCLWLSWDEEDIKFWDIATYQWRITWLSWDRKDLKAWDELFRFWLFWDTYHICRIYWILGFLDCLGTKLTWEIAGQLGFWDILGCPGTERHARLGHSFSIDAAWLCGL